MAHLSKAQVKTYRSLQQKKYREQLGLFVAEGEKCIGELGEHLELVAHISSENATSVEIEQISSLRTPQGSIGIFRIPTYEVPTQVEGLVLALDGVQDPGNLGTIIRTADWYGVRHIYCSRQTADCFSSKVVQATMGALGRVQVHYLDLPEWISREAQSGTPVYGTLLDGRNMYEEGAIPSPERGIIVMGNEGNGITPEVRALLTHPLYIPAYAERPDTVHVESLNVGIATAIILAEFRRRI